MLLATNNITIKSILDEFPWYLRKANFWGLSYHTKWTKLWSPERGTINCSYLKKSSTYGDKLTLSITRNIKWYWEIRCYTRIYSLAESSKEPWGSRLRAVTASKCATIACTHFELAGSKNRMCLSSCALMISGIWGWDMTDITDPTDELYFPHGGSGTLAEGSNYRSVQETDQSICQ